MRKPNNRRDSLGFAVELRQGAVEDREAAEQQPHSGGEHAEVREEVVHEVDRRPVEAVDDVEQAGRRLELHAVEPAVVQRNEAEEDRRALRRERREQRDDADVDAVGVALLAQEEEEADGEDDERRAQAGSRRPHRTPRLSVITPPARRVMPIAATGEPLRAA